MVEEKNKIDITIIQDGEFLTLAEYETMNDEQKLQYHYGNCVFGRFEKQNPEYAKLTAWPKNISFDEFNPNNPQEVCNKVCDRLIADETDAMLHKVSMEWMQERPELFAKDDYWRELIEDRNKENYSK